MQEIDCIFCRVASNGVFAEENGWFGRKCPSCGLIYVSPRPTAGEIEQLYAADDAHIPAEEHISGEHRARLYARHHLGVIQTFCRSGSLLEIGAGAGYFLDEARTRGFEPAAIEFNPAQAAFIRTTLGIPCEERPLDDSSFAGRAFDVLYHCDVTSHFYDPFAEFGKMRRALRPGGWLVFETGNGGDVAPHYFRHFRTLQYPDHLFSFGLGNIRRLLDDSDFELVAVHAYSVMPQLHVLHALDRLRRLTRRRALGDAATPVRAARARAPRTGATRRSRASRLVDYANYVLRYRIGSLAPKAQRPQTLLIVARARRRTAPAAQA